MSDRNIKFTGQPEVRDEMLSLVDEIMKTTNKIKGALDISAGLFPIAKTALIRIVDEDDTLSVTITEIGTSKNILAFVIHKETKTPYQPDAVPQEEVPVDSNMDFLDDLD